MFVQQKQLGTSDLHIKDDRYWRLILEAIAQASPGSGNGPPSKRPVLEIPQHATAPEQGYPKDIHKDFPDIPDYIDVAEVTLL